MSYSAAVKNSLQNLSTDNILEALGLERRRNVFPDVALPSLAIFAAGALLGAAGAVLLTTKTGPALRRELVEGAKDLSQRIGSTASSVVQDYVGSSSQRNHAPSPTT
jgi:hypothetical protein